MTGLKIKHPRPFVLKDLIESPAQLDAAVQHAPYLANLNRVHGDVASAMRADGADAVFSSVLGAINGLLDGPQDIDAVMKALRIAKARGHFAIALAELSGVWNVAQATRAITDLADACTHAALWAAYNKVVGRDWMEPCASPEDMGLFAIAMGKMGAHELNYSSDVDLVMLFDPERFRAKSRSAKEAAVRITQEFVNIMETRNADGYVFRVDLRLRPDPSSNAVALSTETALNYYESYGQNWERMAHIKARPCAGDVKAGAAYLMELEPFIWRRHLDYWAIGDIHAIKRQIHSHKGLEGIDHAEFDAKLGAGGIREIEFFAQTQQLILGGREPQLRLKRTDDALDKLAEMEVIAQDDADDIKYAYNLLRSLEHRIQIRNDEQTHKLPAHGKIRDDIAWLSGYGEFLDGMEHFDADIAAVRRCVHGLYSDLFGEEDRLSGEHGNLVFTGVDDDPGTVQTLADMGFTDPSRVIDTVRRWHRGGLPATRSARGRELLTSLTPRILTWMSEAAEPDSALARFSEFLSGLRGGVQVFSLMMAESAFARDLILAMAHAPKLARDLARQPALLDGMLTAQFQIPLREDSETRVLEDLRETVQREEGFEDQLNAARRFHREEQLRIGYHILRGHAQADVAGEAYARLAEACIEVMSQTALAEVQRRFGDWSAAWVVCGLGKLGGRELSATSDLDLIVIYDPGAPPPPDDLAPRFTQRLIAALSAPTEEGMLYEVDMRLRPSGKAGPVAVKLSSFQRYYREEAWTWEFMALTRLRVIAGDEELAEKVRGAKMDALAERSGHSQLHADVLDMRQRLFREKPAASMWDVKNAEGGLIDVEFIVQQEIIKNAMMAPEVVQANTAHAIRALADYGDLDAGSANMLLTSYQMQLNVQQALRITSEQAFDVEKASDGQKAWLAKAVGCPSFKHLEQRLMLAQKRVADIRLKKIGPIATE